jgi:hypothetical protein
MNTITIELCTEDRARLDRLTAALEKRAAQEEPLTVIDPMQKALAETLAKATPSETAGNEPQATEEPTKAETPIKEETRETAPWDPIETFAQHGEKPKPEEAKPAVTLPQIQQKVVQLSAADNGKKKAKVREIIVAYSPTVSGIKDMPETWSSIWESLTALEKEA